MVLVSLMTTAPDDAHIKSLTFATATPEDKKRTRESWHAIDVATSAAVMVFILGAYLYFRG